MPRGGRRSGAGRKKVERPTNTAVALNVLHRAQAEQLWHRIIAVELARINHAPKIASTAGLRDTLKYLECRAYGNCTDNVNHMHDKPIDLNVTLSMAEIVREVRERKAQYERSRS